MRPSRALFGLVPFEGAVTLECSKPDLGSSQKAFNAGVGLVAKDRTEESVAMSMTIGENTFFNPKVKGRLLSLLSPRV
jgi:ribose transport system ATP-binding protein